MLVTVPYTLLVFKTRRRKSSLILDYIMPHAPSCYSLVMHSYCIVLKREKKKNCCRLPFRFHLCVKRTVTIDSEWFSWNGMNKGAVKCLFIEYRCNAFCVIAGQCFKKK